jgi:WD40 repeat protein
MQLLEKGRHMIPTIQRFAVLLLFWLPVALSAGCGWYGMFSSPAVPEYRQPSEADIQQMTNRMMGKATPKREASISSDGVQVVFQTGHAGGIRNLALSPNGRFIASSGQDGTVKIWDVAGGQEVRTLTGYGMLGADWLGFSPDSQRLITAEMGNGVKVMEVNSGREILTVGSLMSVNAAVSGDGRIVVAQDMKDKTSKSDRLFGSERVLAVIDLGTGQRIWTLPNAEAQTPLALNADGTILLTLKTDTSAPISIGAFLGFGTPSMPSMQQDILVWDLQAKKLRKSWSIKNMLEGAPGKLSPNGRWLVREDHMTRSLILTDVESGKAVQTIPTGLSATSGMTNSLTFSPDGTFLAFATSDGNVKLIEVPSGRIQATLPSSAVAFSRDGTQMVLASENGGAPFLRDVHSGKDTRLAGGVSGVADLAMAQQGRALVAAMEGGSAKLWDLATGQILRTFDCPGGVGVRSAAMNDHAALLGTGCMDGSVWLWDFHNAGRPLRNLLPPRPAGQFIPTAVRFSPNGKNVLAAVGDQVTMWDVATGQELRRIGIPHRRLPAALSPLSNPESAYEGMPSEYRAMLKERVPEEPAMDSGSFAKMEEMSHWIQSIAVHPNGRLVAVGKQHEMSLWDLQTGKQIRQFLDAGPALANAERQRMRQQEYQKALEDAGSFTSVLPFGLGAPARSSTPSPGVMVMDDPSDLLEAMTGDSPGAHSLAFSPDGRWLLSDSAKGKDVWDVGTGKKMRGPKPSRAQGFDPMSMLKDVEFNMGGMGVAFSPDGRLAARGHGEVIKVWDVTTGQDRWTLIGHTAAVKSMQFSPNGRTLLSGGSDGALRIWSLQTGKEQASLIALGQEDFVAVTPDQYYRASKSRIKGVSFRVKGQLYPFEQFDLRFNRPDIVLTRLGLAPDEIIQSYRLAFEKRLKKMGLTEQMLGSDFHLPEVQILTPDIPVTIKQTTLTLRVKATDSKYLLDRLNVFVNDIPLYGTAGLPLQHTQVQVLEQEIQVPLVPGRNKIQVSVLNQQGTESLRETVYTTSTAETASPDVYVVGIGVSDYKEKAYSLRYAAKDAVDVLNTYKAVEQRPGLKGKVHVLDLTNQKATRSEIRHAKEWLKQSKINDLVVVFAAGHGMTDEKSDYYFGTHDIDPKHPATNGLPYEEFENLLDGIPALQKVLLLDTCFSGEIEKEQAVVVAQAVTGDLGTVKMRAFKSARGVSVVSDTGGNQAGAASTPRLSNDMLKFQQDWFADLRRGTGAAVISSSSGNEYSLEGEQWKNGVFTYALLNGLKNREADTNKDRTITVSELQAYVIDQVRTLTQGGQNPTVRRENLEYDFAVY